MFDDGLNLALCDALTFNPCDIFRARPNDNLDGSTKRYIHACRHKLVRTLIYGPMCIDNGFHIFMCRAFDLHH